MTREDRIVDIATQLAVAALRSGNDLQGSRAPSHLISHATAILEGARRAAWEHETREREARERLALEARSIAT